MQSTLKVELLDKLRRKQLSYDELVHWAKHFGVSIPTDQERAAKIAEYGRKKYIAYPSLDDNEFQKKIALKKEFYENRYFLENMSEEELFQFLCRKDEEFQLLSYQTLIRNYINANTPYNGILLFHGLGTGKTCSAISIAEAYRTSIENIGKNKILVFTSGGTITSNFRQELHDFRKEYRQCTYSEYAIYNPQDTDEVKQKKIDALIDSRYDFEGYQKFANKMHQIQTNNPGTYRQYIRDNYSNRTVVIDEVHNLKLQDVKDKKVKIKRYSAVMELVKNVDNTKLILLSGTPMAHSPTEIVDVLNLLLINDKRKPLKQHELFNKRGDLTKDGEEKLIGASKGYISYVSNENPYTFPVRFYPEETEKRVVKTASEFMDYKFRFQYDAGVSREYKLVMCPMKGRQLENYTKYIRETETKQIAVSTLTQLQLISYDPKKKNATIHKKMKPKEFLGENLETLSSKMYQLIRNIKEAKGPIFIYSYYLPSGIYAIVQLLQHNGYILNEKRDDTKDFFVSSAFSRPEQANLVCAICGEKMKKHGDVIDHDFQKSKFDMIVARTTEDAKEKIKKMFNSDANKDGTVLKIIVGSYVLREGISFFNVRQLHIMEPWHNKSRLDQIIGRGRRYCSHKSLSRENRNITLFLYCSVVGMHFEYDEEDKEDVEQHLRVFMERESNITDLRFGLRRFGKLMLSYDVIMYKRMELLSRKVKKVETILKKNAVDCPLNRLLNIDLQNAEDRFECYDYQRVDLTKDIIDDSTYNNLFLTPYIKYVTTIVRTLFKAQQIVYESTIRKDPRLQSEIYRVHPVLIEKALYSLVSRDKQLQGHQYVVQHKTKNGYLISRSVQNDAMYIFVEFDDQKKIARSTQERRPIYELYLSDQRDRAMDLKVSVEAIMMMAEELPAGVKKSKIAVEREESRTAIAKNEKEIIKRKKNKIPFTETDGPYMLLVITLPGNIIKYHLRKGKNKGQDINTLSKAKKQKAILEIAKILGDEYTKERKMLVNMAKEKVENKVLAETIVNVLTKLNEDRFRGKKWKYTI